MINWLMSIFSVLQYVLVTSAIIIVLNYIIKYINKVIQGKNLTADDEYYINHPILNPSSSFEDKVLYHLEEIKELAEKISEEKKELESGLALEEVSDVLKQCCEFREQVRRELEEEHERNRNKYEQLHIALAHLQKDVALYRSEVNSMTKALTAPLSVQEEKSSSFCKRMSEIAVQTEECTGVFFNEAADLNVSEETLIVIKNSVMTMSEENEKAWLKDVIDALSNLEYNYTDIKSLITSYWTDISGEISACSSIVDNVQKVEQTVFGILLFLQQQSFDAQTVRETLKFFDHKFEKFMKRSKSRWKMSTVKLDQAFECVRKAQAVMDESSSGFVENSMVTMRQMTCLDLSVKEFSGIAKLIYEAERLTGTVEKNICALTANMTIITAKIDGEYCRRLNIISQDLLKPGENLHVLFKATEDLHVYADIIKKNTTKCASPTSSVRSSTSDTELAPTETVIVSEESGYGNIITSEVLPQSQEQDSSNSSVDISCKAKSNKSNDSISHNPNYNPFRQEVSSEKESVVQIKKDRPSKEDLRHASASRRSSTCDFGRHDLD